jgi:hypothetical protein
MTTNRCIGAVLLAVGAGAGCDPPPRSPPTPVCSSTSQGCPDADVARADVPATDVAFDASFDDAWTDAAVIEAGTPTEAGTDPIVVDPCAAGSIVDLATAGTRDGNVTRYTGDNRGIAAGSNVGWVCGPTDSPVFHRYVPTTSGRLSVDAQRVVGASDLSPYVMVADGCGTLGYGGPNVFACVNPSLYLSLGIFPRAVLSVTAGVPIYVVVAGARGSYALTITEATVVGVGATCDRAGVMWTCAAGLSCSSTEPPRCVADGTLGGACREGPSDCDTGLRCASGHCLTPSTGPGCLPTCPPGSSCAWDGVADRCVPYGTNGGDCRPGTSPCDSGLACSAISHRCRPTSALGAACDGAGATSACVAGADCVLGVCAVVGVSGARCRPSGGPTACDAGLICNESCAGCAGGRCVPRTAAGGACVSSFTCAAGTTCATSGGASICAADGTTTGALCRRSLTGPLCDAGLTCSDRNHCAPTLAAGAPCGGSIEGACVAGTGCQHASATDGGVATQARCLPAPYAESTAPAGGYIDACATGRSEPFYSRDVIDNRTLRPLSLPFAFRYYGRAQTLFWPGTGAWGSFGANRPTISDVRFLQAPTGAELLQPFGAHTSPVPGSNSPSVWLQPSGSRICTATVGAAPDRRFAVEWNDLTIGNAGTAAHLTFEVVLHETTHVIDFLYRRLDYTPGADLEVDVGLVGGWDDPRTIHRAPVSTAAGVRFTPR